VSAEPVVLAPESIAALADAVAERLRAPADVEPAPALLTAPELAERLAVDPKTVYRNADLLGAIRVGRALRFDLDRALTAWAIEPGSRDTSGRSLPATTAAATGRKASRPKAKTGSHCQLLPVGRRTTAVEGGGDGR
jgi:hypothetical protein